jgi:hypothetical protein
MNESELMREALEYYLKREEVEQPKFENKSSELKKSFSKIKIENVISKKEKSFEENRNNLDDLLGNF